MTALGLSVLGACNGSGLEDKEPWEVPPPNDLPVLEIVEPARGSFTNEAVVVRGRATAGTGALTSLDVNGQGVVVTGAGSLETTIDAPPGLLIIGSRLDDDLGERAVDGRAVQVGDTNPPGAVIPNAVAIHIGPDLLDDDDPELDDMARLVEVVATDPAFGARISGTTLDSDTMSITITSMSVATADVDLIPRDGYIEMEIVLGGVHTEFIVDVYGVLSTTGSTDMEEVTLAVDLGIGADANGVVVEALWSEAEIDGFEWEAKNVPSWMEGLLSDTLQATLEQRLEESAVDLVGTVVADTLSSLALSTTLANDAVQIDLRLASAECTYAGLTLGMSGSAKALSTPFALPPGGGSLRTAGAAPVLPLTGLSSRPLQAVVDDDFVNQVLFAFWYAGVMSNRQFSGVELALLSGGPMPPPLGPVARATIGTQLPPIVSPTTGELQFDLGIGELWFDLEREDGQKVAASVNMKAGASLVNTSAGLAMTIDNRPSFMTVHAGMREWPEALDPGDLASLFRLSTPSLLGKVADFFPAFPTPEIPLDALVDADALAGRTWVLIDPLMEMDAQGFLRIKGRLGEE